MFWMIAGALFLLIVRPYEMQPWLGSLRIEFVFNSCALLMFAFYKRKEFFLDPIKLCFFAFLAALALSTAFGVDAQHAFERYFKYIKVSLVFIMMMFALTDSDSYEKMFKAFFVVTAIYVALSLYEFLCGRMEYRMGIVRMLGYGHTYSNPNSFASTIALSYPIVLALYKMHRLRPFHWTFKYALYGYVPMSLGCLLLTGSRSGFLQVLCFCFLLLLSAKKKAIAFTLVGVTMVVGWFMLPETIQNRYLSIIDPSVAPAAEAAQDSAQGRIGGMLNGIYIFSKNPVFGVGPGNITLTYKDGERIKFQTHNFLGQILSDAGLVGTIPFFMMMLLIYTRSKKGIQRGKMYLARPRDDVGEMSASDLHMHNAVIILECAIYILLILLLAGLFGHNLYRYHWVFIVYLSSVGLLNINRLRRHAPAPAADNGRRYVKRPERQQEQVVTGRRYTIRQRKST